MRVIGSSGKKEGIELPKSELNPISAGHATARGSGKGGVIYEEARAGLVVRTNRS